MLSIWWRSIFSCRTSFLTIGPRRLFKSLRGERKFQPDKKKKTICIEASKRYKKESIETVRDPSSIFAIKGKREKINSDSLTTLIFFYSALVTSGVNWLGKCCVPSVSTSSALKKYVFLCKIIKVIMKPSVSCDLSQASLDCDGAQLGFFSLQAEANSYF